MPLYGERLDGTLKGRGFFGPLKRPDKRVSTEISIGVNFDGRETLIPSIVPGLDQHELGYLLSTDSSPEMFKTPLGKGIMEKAVRHAKDRISLGKSPFIQEGEEIMLSPIEEEIKLMNNVVKTNN